MSSVWALKYVLEGLPLNKYEKSFSGIPINCVWKENVHWGKVCNLCHFFTKKKKYLKCYDLGFYLFVSVCDATDQTQGLLFARQELYQLSLEF